VAVYDGLEWTCQLSRIPLRCQRRIAWQRFTKTPFLIRIGFWGNNGHCFVEVLYSHWTLLTGWRMWAFDAFHLLWRSSWCCEE